MAPLHKGAVKHGAGDVLSWVTGGVGGVAHVFAQVEFAPLCCAGDVSGVSVFFVSAIFNVFLAVTSCMLGVTLWLGQYDKCLLSQTAISIFLGGKPPASPQAQLFC